MDENKKKTAKKVADSVLEALFPDHLKRANENSGWCKTVSSKPGDKKPKKQKRF
ncbi:MAG: hypothetical protein R2747_01585 [Pyrinomonadaceae bacterium]